VVAAPAMPAVLTIVQTSIHRVRGQCCRLFARRVSSARAWFWRIRVQVSRDAGLGLDMAGVEMRCKLSGFGMVLTGSERREMVAE
jgi:hypothetical protein